MTERAKELQSKISHLNSVIEVLEGNAGVYEYAVFGKIEVQLEHDTKHRMLNTMIKYRNELENALTEEAAKETIGATMKNE